MITKALIKLNRANNSTTSPAVLKKIPEYLLCLILKELKLSNAKTGNVPRAKISIVRAPFRKLPVESV